MSYSMLRNSASGPGIGLPGQILAGLLPGKHRKRHSGRPTAGRRADFGAFPVAVRPKCCVCACFVCAYACCRLWTVLLVPGGLGASGAHVAAVRNKNGQNPARKADLRPGDTVA